MLKKGNVGRICLTRTVAITRKLNVLWMITIFVCTLTAPPTKAGNRFDTFVFNYYMASEFGDNLTSSINEYFSARNEFQIELARAEQAVEACNGCPQAKAELEKLQAEERWFQDTAYRLAGRSGMPPNVANWLGIETDFLASAAAAPSTFELGEGLVVTEPDWLSSAPDFCHGPIRSYLMELRAYQESMRSSRISHLLLPGTDFFDRQRLYNACKEGNHEEFKRLTALAEEREKGRILPEIDPVVSGSHVRKSTVYFGKVPEDFVPAMPPPDVVREKLTEPGVGEVTLVMNKNDEGKLVQARIRTLSPSVDLDQKTVNACTHIRPTDWTELLKRACEDIWEIKAQPPLVLDCGYRTYPSGDKAKQSRLYWYDEQASITETEYTLPRSHTHPFLAIGALRSNCPRNIHESDEIKAAEQTRLMELIAKIEQIPETVSIPSSPWNVKRQQAAEESAKLWLERKERTRTFYWPGYYGFKTETSAGDCVVAAYAVSENQFRIACWSDEEVFVGLGNEAVGFKSLHGDFGAMTGQLFGLDDTHDGVLVSETNSASMQRKQSLSSITDYDLDGDFLLTLSKAQMKLQALCRFLPTSYGKHDFGKRQLNCTDQNGRHLLSDDIREPKNFKDEHPIHSLDALGGLFYYPSQQQAYKGQRTVLRIGDTNLGDMWFVIDPRFQGSDVIESPLLVFSESGISGEMRRLRESDPSAALGEQRSLSGEWSGNYQCGKSGVRRVNVLFDDPSEGAIRKVTAKVAYSDPASSASGQFNLEGIYAEELGMLRLDHPEPPRSIRYYSSVPPILYGAVLEAPVDKHLGTLTIVAGNRSNKLCGDLKLQRSSAQTVKSFDSTIAKKPEKPAQEHTEAQEPVTLIHDAPEISNVFVAAHEFVGSKVSAATAVLDSMGFVSRRPCKWQGQFQGFDSEKKARITVFFKALQPCTPESLVQGANVVATSYPSDPIEEIKAIQASFGEQGECSRLTPKRSKCVWREPERFPLVTQSSFGAISERTNQNVANINIKVSGQPKLSSSH